MKINLKTLKFALLVLLFYPVCAHAYLDPGTGNALAAALFGLIGSFIFFAKNIYYKIKSKFNGQSIISTTSELAFFSEGSKYWIYYKDIIDELIKKEQFFTYYTMDIEDPAFQLLDFGNSNININSFNIRYVGKGNKGYAAISNLKEPVLITTTPNIDTSGYPIKKPKKCKSLIHIFHSLSSIGGYHKYSLDNFDTVILSGKEFEKDIRDLEKKRNLSIKKLLVGGCPYIDSLIKRIEKLDVKTDGKTVLIASTWNKRGVLKTYGKNFIEKIAKSGYNIIVRPHPYSYVFEPDFINQLQKDLSNYKNVDFDSNVDGLMTLAKADIMISDISHVRLDYYLAFGRPIITLDTDCERYSQIYESSDLDSCWDIEISKKIGLYLKKDEINNIVETILSMLTHNKPILSKIDQDKIITNIGSSAKIIAGQIVDIVNDKI